MTKKPRISHLRHRVQLCSQKDIVEDGNFFLVREGVLETWAEITEKKTQVFSPGGEAIDERDKRSHIIRIRYRHDLEISVYAWIFERRMKSSPRWFKILKVSQTEDSGSPFYIFDVRLVERSDTSVEPIDQGPAKDLPDGVVF